MEILAEDYAKTSASHIASHIMSYKDMLLSAPGIMVNEDNLSMENVEDDSPVPENRWYHEEEEVLKGDKPFDLCLKIPVSKEEFDEWCKPWHTALIVKVLGKRVGLGFLEQRLNRDWVKKGEINVIDMDHDYFLVHFSYEEDYSHALLGGPWMIAGHYLIVQRWRPFFLESENEVKKISAWIQIPNLPTKLYNHKFLWRVGFVIGSLLKIDRATSIHSRVLGSTLNIQYEGIHLICFNCGKYGHKSELCNEAQNGGEFQTENISASEPEGEATNQSSPTDNSNNHANQGAPISQQSIPNNHDPPKCGPWMMEKRHYRRKQERFVPKNKVNHNGYDTQPNKKESIVDVDHDVGSGSRFNVLFESNPENTLPVTEDIRSNNRDSELMSNGPIEPKNLRSNIDSDLMDDGPNKSQAQLEKSLV
ncbi:hypothetical protein Ahy_A06g030084 [Arachis hypogaea]|uniref:CCHC-type domain-containing protein n=1 Tax=Arachis hypogaea TaxID=3818 RepID=A0A445CV48_ARAHY|nr:hypothetical protein Ahy_A06g030084 [Arachis hypogaea]